MTDNKLRCALVYRIEEDDVSATETGTTVAVTMLAKYDHASQYETRGGAPTDESAPKYADAVGAVLRHDPPERAAIASSSSERGATSLGVCHMRESEAHLVVCGVDADGLCVAMIAGREYPLRVAVRMLDELHKQFTATFGRQWKSAAANSLTKKSKPLLSALCKKYDDLDQADKLSSLTSKVEVVKASMHQNISDMFDNVAKGESLAMRAEDLNAKADVFRKNADGLRKQMRCKNLKMTILLTLLVVGVLCVVLAPLILWAKSE